MKVICVLKLCVLVSVFAQTLPGPKHHKKVVCYIASWAGYRPDPGKYTIEDLEPSLCTHLVYSFAGLNETTNSIMSLDPWQDLETNYGLAGYKRLVALKETYPHLKVTLAIGGWNERSPKYSEMAAKPESRAAFIDSVLTMLSNYDFDGLDLDLVYPSNNDGKLNERENFVSLVKELSEAFKPRGLILTAAIGAGKSTMDIAYEMNQYLDLIHMMCYDYHGSWERVLGANAPLRGRGKDDSSSVENSINYMLNRGIPPSKLVIGLPMYGRTFYLVNPDVKELKFGSTLVKEIGFNGPLTGQAGFMGYFEICMETSNSSSPWVYHWHDEASIPYLRDGERVITYDNGRSIALKAKFAIEKGLGGLMVWSVDTDDYKGNCRETDAYIDFKERYQRMVYDPLSRKAAENLNIPHINEAPKDGPSYVLKDNQLHLRLPQAKFSNYALMQTINDAMALSVEEKRIEDEMERIMKENEVNIRIEDDGSSSKSSVMHVFMIAFPGNIDRRMDSMSQEGPQYSFRFY